MNRRVLLCVLAINALCLTTVHSTHAEITDPDVVPAPTTFLQKLDTQVQQIVRGEGSDTLSAEDNARVRNLINSAFDFEELSRLSLGEHWDGRTMDERRDFVSVYRGIIERRNFDIFVQYYREGDISYVAEAIDDSGRARVEAQVPMKRETKQIVYAMHQPQSQDWRIYDLSIDGASTVDGNRRTYGRYIARHSFEKLLERLRVQLTQLQQDDR